MSELSRRSAFAAIAIGAAALPAAASLPHLVPAGEIASHPRLAELEQLIRKMETAISAELDLEGVDQVAYEAARKHAHAAQEMFDRCSADVFSQPAVSWLDIAIRARIAGYWKVRSEGSISDEEIRSTGELIAGVFAMLGMKPLSVEPREPVTTVAGLIGALGGAHEVADHFGIGVDHVGRWARVEFIPSGWHLRLVRWAGARGISIHPSIFEA